MTEKHPLDGVQDTSGNYYENRVVMRRWAMDGMLHARRPREVNEWTVCEEFGFQERDGVCPIHGGDACLIVVAWVDNSHVRRDLSRTISAIFLARAALEDALRHTTDERLGGVIRVTLEHIEEQTR